MGQTSTRLGALVGISLLLVLLVGDQPLAAHSASCQFTTSLAELRQAIGADIVGDCLEDEIISANGDRRQLTTKGELVWRNSDNRGVFTNGYETWLNGPDGIARRLNSERFPWERDDQIATTSSPTTSQIAALPATPTLAPTAAITTTPTAVPSTPTPSLPSRPTTMASALLRAALEIGAGLRLGGISGLAALDRTGLSFVAVTDRGPNKDGEVKGDKVATFLLPSFSPSILKLRRDQDGLQVIERIPLRLSRGKNPITGGPEVSGLPNGDNDEAAYDAAGRRKLGTDSSGVDTEGIAVDARDGSFWICEEYGPSILHVKSDGTILTRLVPKGLVLKDAGYDVKPVLPAVLLKRKQNRGFEGIAISPDGATIFAILQSPLSIPDEDAGEASRNPRIVAVDVLGEPRTVATYLYQTEPYQDVGAHEQDDVKVGDLVAISSTRLLAIERDSGDTASHRKVYQIDLSNATDVKDRSFSSKPLEEMSDGDLTMAKVTAVTKRMVVDLMSLGFAHELVEGLAMVDEATLAIVNDNNFNASEPSEMMLIRLSEPLR